MVDRSISEGDIVSIRVFDDGNDEFESLPNQYEVVDVMGGKVKLMNLATKTVVSSISSWKVGKDAMPTGGRQSAMTKMMNKSKLHYIDFTVADAVGAPLHVTIRAFGFELGQGIGVRLADKMGAPYVIKSKGLFYDAAVRAFGGKFNPSTHLKVLSLRINDNVYRASQGANAMREALHRLARLEYAYRPALASQGSVRETMGTMGSHGGPYFDMTWRPAAGTMGRPTMGTYGKGTCGTMAIAGQASKLLAKAKSVGRGAKSAVGDQYWKSVSEKVGDNLKSQHTNFIEQHKAHAKEWAAELNNLIQDLKAAQSALAKAEGLPNEDPKKEKKVKAAEEKQEKVLAKMDKWLESHDDQPREKIAQMFEPFELGGVKAEKKLEKLDKAVHKAMDDLEGKYTPITYKAVTEAQKIIADAVKAAVALGWPAKGLSNRAQYGL
jgi:hypothetical protein